MSRVKYHFVTVPAIIKFWHPMMKFMNQIKVMQLMIKTSIEIWLPWSRAIRLMLTKNRNKAKPIIRNTKV